MGAVLQKPMFTECCGDRGEEVPAPGEWRNTPGLSGLFPISHFAGHPQHGGPPEAGAGPGTSGAPLRGSADPEVTIISF